MLMDILPLLRGYSWNVKDIDVETPLTVGKPLELFRTPLPGYLINFALVVNNPLAEIELQWFQGRMPRKLTGKPYGLFMGGATEWGGFLYSPLYDTTLKLYTIAYCPVSTQLLSWDKDCFMKLHANAAGDKIVDYAHTAIVIDDMEEFKKSWREIFATKVEIERLIRR